MEYFKRIVAKTITRCGFADKAEKPEVLASIWVKCKWIRYTVMHTSFVGYNRIQMYRVCPVVTSISWTAIARQLKVSQMFFICRCNDNILYQILKIMFKYRLDRLQIYWMKNDL